MRSSAFLLLASAVMLAPSLSAAHTGGPLDTDGCHADRRLGGYHCHQGEAQNYNFPSQAAMREAVATGNLPEKPEKEETWLSRLWPFGKKTDAAPVSAPAPEPASNAPAAVTTAPATAPPAPVPSASAPVVQVAPPPPSPVQDAATPSAPKPKVLPKVAAPATPANVASPPPPAAPSSQPLRTQREFEERLRTIEALRKEGLLTQEEYEAKRKAVLDQL